MLVGAVNIDPTAALPLRVLGISSPMGICYCESGGIGQVQLFSGDNGVLSVAAVSGDFTNDRALSDSKTTEM